MCLRHETSNIHIVSLFGNLCMCFKFLVKTVGLVMQQSNHIVTVIIVIAVIKIVRWDK